MLFETRKDAVYHWVETFDAIPQDLLIEWNESKDGYGLRRLTPYKKDTEDYYPMWGTMWSFHDSTDNWWLENNLDVMNELGFVVFESEDYGYFFGIDGAGYDFYDAHWIPLYEKRGLRWSKED